MPRYFFHCLGKGMSLDTTGTVLADDATAKLDAVLFTGETLKDDPARLWSQGQWRVEVADDQGARLFSVIALAVRFPPLIPRPRDPAND